MQPSKDCSSRNYLPLQNAVRDLPKFDVRSAHIDEYPLSLFQSVGRISRKANRELSQIWQTLV